MKKPLIIAAGIAVLCAEPAYADVTLNYQLSGPDMEDRIKTFSLARFFARIDDPVTPDTYLLYQTGKFFPLYQVDKSTRSYTLLTPEVKPTLHAAIAPKPAAAQGKTAVTSTEAAQAQLKTAAPALPATVEQPTGGKTAESSAETAGASQQTTLRLTNKKQKIAGIECRIIEELAGALPVMTHCMADKVHLGITERELRSLGRLFKMARERNLGWLGTATPDEKFVSVSSEDLQSHKTLQLKSLSTKPLPSGYLRIPGNFKPIPRE